LWLGNLGNAAVLLQNCDSGRGFMSGKMFDGLQQFWIFLPDDLVE
jgi:hypothetical protein